MQTQNNIIKHTDLKALMVDICSEESHQTDSDYEDSDDEGLSIPSRKVSKLVQATCKIDFSGLLSLHSQSDLDSPSFRRVNVRPDAFENYTIL